MSEYNPDKWAIVRFKKEEKIWYKVLGSWYGGYLGSDYWRLSSGLEQIEEDGDLYLMKNYSGSVYKCHKKANGMSTHSSGIYQNIKEQGKENGVDVSIIDVKQFMGDLSV